MKLRHILIGTGLGMGFSPIAPGTVASVGGLLVAVLLRPYIPFYQWFLLIFIVVFFFLGVYSATKLETDWGKDPSEVVIDEIVGIWISLCFLPQGWGYSLAALVLFRLFDIYKPLYIKKMENLKVGWGIMMDDVVAGIYANVAIQLFCLIKVWF
jgi:Phosphatidylglycerophosphatase A and related proteins